MLTTTQGLRQGDQPVFPQGMKIAERAKGGHGVRFRNSSIVVVEFIMDSLAGQGTPAKVLHGYLQGSFSQDPERLGYHCLKFDVDSGNLKGHKRKLINLVKNLNR